MLRRLKFSGYLSLDITIYHHISPLSPSIMYVCIYIYHIILYPPKHGSRKYQKILQRRIRKKRTWTHVDLEDRLSFTIDEDVPLITDLDGLELD